MSKYYLRNDKTGEITTTTDIVRWGREFELSDRTVAQTKIGRDVQVSTVFLGLDHNFSFGGNKPSGNKPILFETMVFGGALNEEQARCCTEVQALQEHVAMVWRVIAGLEERDSE